MSSSCDLLQLTKTTVLITLSSSLLLLPSVVVPAIGSGGDGGSFDDDQYHHGHHDGASAEADETETTDEGVVITDPASLERARDVQRKITEVHEELLKKIDALRLKYYTKEYTLKKQRNQLLSSVAVRSRASDDDVKASSNDNEAHAHPTSTFWSHTMQFHPEMQDLVGWVDEEHVAEWQAIHDEHHQNHHHHHHQHQKQKTTHHQKQATHDDSTSTSTADGAGAGMGGRMTEAAFSPQHLLLDHIVDIDVKPLDKVGSFRYSVKLAPNEFIANNVLWREEYVHDDSEDDTADATSSSSGSGSGSNSNGNTNDNENNNLRLDAGDKHSGKKLHRVEFTTSGVQWKNKALSHHGQSGLFIHPSDLVKQMTNDGGRTDASSSAVASTDKEGEADVDEEEEEEDKISHLVFSPLIYFFEKRKSNYHYTAPSHPHHHLYLAQKRDEEHAFFHGRVIDSEDNKKSAKEAANAKAAAEEQAMQDERNFDDRVASFLQDIFEECVDIFDGNGRWDDNNPDSIYAEYNKMYEEQHRQHQDEHEPGIYIPDEDDDDDEYDDSHQKHDYYDTGDL